jgi:UDP-N-acetyl-D-mannosaminuronic acid dehydrogenase
MSLKPVERIAVIGGAGHVGLPLSLFLAKSGFSVVVVDKDRAKMDFISSGNIPFIEKDIDELLHACKHADISYTDQYSSVSSCDVVIVTIGTPVDEHLNPYLTPVYQCIESLKPYLKKGQCIVLRSTLFPGTSEHIYQQLRDDGYEVGVCFCPERIAQGYAVSEMPKIAQIVSGNDADAVLIARSIFEKITPHIIEMPLIEAELTKLYCNAWRYLKFAVANQFYTIALDKGLDFQRIRHAMMHEYGRADDFPNSGFAAGPCLFKDTMQLAAFSRQLFTMGHSAMLVNETLPEYLVAKEKQKRSLRGVKVGILGMAFKADNDDSRESLAYKLRKILSYEGAKILCTDPYVKDPQLVSMEQVLEESSVVFLGVPHKIYKDIEFRADQHVVDCWGYYTR